MDCLKCGMKLSPHFTLDEMCKSQLAVRNNIANQPDASAIAAMQRLAKAILEPVRAHFGAPIIPSSGFRSAALNKVLGGAHHSQHCKGEAVDFEIAGIPHVEIALWILRELDFDQLILEYPQADCVRAGWLHVSYAHGRNRRETLTKIHNGYFSGFPRFW